MSFTMMVGMVTSVVIAGLAALWGKAAVKNAKLERDQAREAHEFLTRAGQRLDEARNVKQAPIDPKRRNHFEQQP